MFAYVFMAWDANPRFSRFSCFVLGARRPGAQWGGPGGARGLHGARGARVPSQRRSDSIIRSVAHTLTMMIKCFQRYIRTFASVAILAQAHSDSKLEQIGLSFRSWCELFFNDLPLLSEVGSPHNRSGHEFKRAATSAAHATLGSFFAHLLGRRTSQSPYFQIKHRPSG